MTNQLKYLDEDANVDEIIVLEGGRILERGSASGLKKDPDGHYSRLWRSLQPNIVEDEVGVTTVAACQIELVQKAESPSTPEVITPLDTVTNGDDLKGKPRAQLVKVETRHEGAVPVSTYLTYFNAFGNSCYVMTFLTLYVAAEASTNVGEWWLGKWSENSFELDIRSYVSIYGCVAAFTVGMIITRSFMWAHFYVSVATALHYVMLRRVFWCPMSFFDTTPIGRIINRFSQDQNDIDQALPTSFEAGIIVILRCVAIVILTCIPEPLMIIGVLPLLYLFSMVREYFRRSSREAQRLLAVASSPLYSALEETLNGLSTIRAYSHQERYIAAFDTKLDLSTSFAYLKLALDQWLLQRLNCLAAAVITGCGLCIVLTRKTVDPALAGLALANGLCTHSPQGKL